jgi:hypothetical protein
VFEGVPRNFFVEQGEDFARYALTEAADLEFLMDSNEEIPEKDTKVKEGDENSEKEEF